MITIEQIKRIAEDIKADDGWVNDSHSASEHKGVIMGLDMLVDHLEENRKGGVMNTHENNKLIAQFMGLYTSVEANVISMYYLNYHKSWDWLMPVVKKILDISFQDEGDAEDFYSIRDCMPDINHTYKAVVEFINNRKGGDME